MNFKKLKEYLNWLEYRFNNAIGNDKNCIKSEINKIEPIVKRFESNPINLILLNKDYTNRAEQLLIDVRLNFNRNGN